MNRKELLARIGRQLNKADTLDARTEARLLDALNSRHRAILSAPGCQALRRRQVSLTSVPGRARYGLANGEAIKHLRDLTNDRELSQRALSTYRQFNPDPTTTAGTPDAFISYGFEPVELQPNDLTPGTLYVKSSSPADTTQSLYVEGTYLPGAAYPLTGTTPVSLGGPYTYLNKLYLSALCAGLVSVHLDSPTGTQLTVFAGQTMVRWLAFYLDPTPTAAITYAVDAEFVITDLAQDTDEPWLPSDFHDVLELGTVMDELHHTDDGRMLVFQQRYDRRLGELKLRLARLGMDTGPHGGTSRLGPWTPRW